MCVATHVGECITCCIVNSSDGTKASAAAHVCIVLSPVLSYPIQRRQKVWAWVALTLPQALANTSLLPSVHEPAAGDLLPEDVDRYI